MSLLAALIMIAVRAVVPDVPGQRAQTQLPLRRVLTFPGVPTILVVVFTWMLAHNLLYTYIAPYLRESHLPLRPDLALVAFGVAALIGIWITGLFIDRALRGLTLASVALFAVAGAILLAAQGSLSFALLAIALWGVAFGGAATHLQTAMGAAAGENADVANAMLTTAFNAATGRKLT